MGCIPELSHLAARRERAMLQEAVRRYHDLLDRGNEMERTRDQLWHRLEEARLVFGGRPLSPYLRPHFVSRSQFAFIADVCQRLWPAIERVAHRALGDESLMEYLGLTDGERRLVRLDPGFPDISPTARWDSFLTDGQYHFVELNAETPAGIAYADVASQIFRQLDVMKAFAEHYHLTPLSGREKLLDVLLAAYREFGGRESPPHIAIVDVRGVPTTREFELFQEFFTSRGYPTIIADPRELELRRGKLYAGDFRIDVIYKRLLVNDFLDLLDEAGDLLKAYEAGAVCLVNSFRGKLIHKKLLFGVFTDERFASLFTDQERELMRRHIPWTRRFEDRRTTYRGEDIDLVAFVRRNRHHFVLKPNDAYGGKGIFIGWELDEARWDAAIQTALQHGYLVQERVATGREVFPGIIDGQRVEFVEQLTDLDPLLFEGRVGSAFTRLSGTELCNVTAGGGMVPTFIIDRK